jgi:shikimate kinase
MKIFLIGPGGVGKSTCGKILAELLEYELIDLDFEFCNRIENIGIYIDKYGYEKYCFENSNLFYKLLSENSEKVLFALSSGFLAHEGLDELTLKHKQTLKESGISVLLLPSMSLDESREIMIKRQLSRGFGLKADKEIIKINERFVIYKNLGDIKIFSYDEPRNIAKQMMKEIIDFSKKIIHL